MIARERFLGWLIAIVFILGGVIGGGRTSPQLSMIVELFACFLGALALASIVDGEHPKQAKPAFLLLALIAAVPVIQLVPLSSHLWRGLPGHMIPDAISRLAGLGDIARPISLDPEQTRMAALSLIVPVAVFMGSLVLRAESRDLVMTVIVGFAAVSALVGVFQVAAGGGIDLGIYRQIHDGYPIGFFANRNHEGDLLLIAIPMSVYLIRSCPWPHGMRAICASGAVVFFLVSVVATTSRAALALTPLSLAGALLIWSEGWNRRIWIGIAILLATSAVAYLLISMTPVGHRVIHRFDTAATDLRPVIWRGVTPAIRSFWPIGSGIGTFSAVYAMFEDLNFVTDAWVNHAHNDYLEILLETGAAGAVLLALYGLLFLMGLIRRIPRPLRGQRYVAVTSILILLAHSLVDYPLRTFALVSIFAFSNAMLFPSRDGHGVRRSGSHPVAAPPPAFSAAPSNAR